MFKCVGLYLRRAVPAKSKWNRSSSQNLSLNKHLYVVITVCSLYRRHAFANMNFA